MVAEVCCNIDEHAKRACRVILINVFIFLFYECISPFFILKFYTVPVPLHDLKKFLNKRALSSKVEHVSIVLPRKYDVISYLQQR